MEGSTESFEKKSKSREIHGFDVEIRRDTCSDTKKIGRLGNLDRSRKKNFRKKIRVFMSKSDVRNKIRVIHG